MNSRLLSGVILSGAAILAGCVQDKAQTPSVMPTEVSLAVGAPSCPWSDLTKNAKVYFALPKDPVYTRLSEMQAAYRAGGPSGATSAGFDVLARLGVAADAGSTLAKGSAAQGSTFANSVLGCMSVLGYSGTIDFSRALDATGLFAVRPAGTTGAVVSRGLASGLPLFGAEPSTSWLWNQNTSVVPAASKLLFYGWELTSVEFDAITGDVEAGATFELNTLPNAVKNSVASPATVALAFDPEIIAGVCVTSGANPRIFHKHSTALILPSKGNPDFCGPDIHATSTGWESAAKLFATVFLPRPLQAVTVGHGASGGLKGLSPIGAVVATPVVTFADSIKDSNLSSGASGQFVPAIAVIVKTAAGTPMPGVDITLSVSGNSGSFTDPTMTVATGVDGKATFTNFYLDKAGGYTLKAVSSEYGVTKLSNAFNISGR